MTRFAAAWTYIVIIVATLIGLEIVARVYDWSPASEVRELGDRLGTNRYEHSHLGAGDLMPKQDGHWMVWFHRPYHVQTNSLGLRNVEEPREAAIRVLALGDSQTFGPYLANEDTWPAWTENALRRSFASSDNVQVFNAGVSGYTILDELSLLEEKALKIKPHLVLLAAYENDLTDLRWERDGRIKRQPPRGPIPGLSKRWRSATDGVALIRVARDIRRRLDFRARGVDVRRGEGNPVTPAEGIPAAGGKVDLSPLKTRYVELFQRMASLLRRNGTKFAVVFIPAAQQVIGRATSEMENVIRDAAQRDGVPFLNLVEPFRRVPDAAARLYLLQEVAGTGELVGNGHLSREGNAVIGFEIARWLKSIDLLPYSDPASRD